MRRTDKILINDLSISVVLEDGARWPSSISRPQPLLLSLEIVHDCAHAALNDDLSLTVDYGLLCATLIAQFRDGMGNGKAFLSVEAFSDSVYDICFERFPEVQELSLMVKKPNALLCASCAKLQSSRLRIAGLHHERFIIEDLSCPVIAGVNACEREEEQIVRFTITLDRIRRSTVALDFRRLEAEVLKMARCSNYLTLEALSSAVARVVLESVGEEADSVTVQAAKPSAILFAESARVELTRTLADYRVYSTSNMYRPSPCVGPLTSLLKNLDQETMQSAPLTRDIHQATIALGSNLGDRFAHIELALQLLESPSELLETDAETKDRRDSHVAVINTSFLYETAPLYVTDQPKFINGACMIETNVTPNTLLELLKKIETVVGRVPSIRNGPRAVDLDILTYDSSVLDTRPEDERTDLENLHGQLVIPHPRMAEREFVLRPLCDIIPTYVHPQRRISIRALLDSLLNSQPTGEFPMYKVIPFPRYPLDKLENVVSKSHNVPRTASYWRYPILSNPHPQNVSASIAFPTYLMATLNATPDSFSDGAAHNQVPSALAYVSSSVVAGAHIVDVGGYSTRPGAAFVTPNDEIERISPIIEAVRNLTNSTYGRSLDPDLAEKSSNILISIDTFRPDVAKAAVLAGANCINDVYAFTGPDYPLTADSVRHFLAMRRVARELNVPVVLMHARGDAATNKDYGAYAYAGEHANVIEAVRCELGERVEAAVRGPGGLRRWNVLVDPGIGFSKTLEGNLQLLRRAAEVTADCVLALPPGYEGPGWRNPLAGFPQLIGASRKSFLGAVLEKPGEESEYGGRKTEPKERGWATAAAVSGAVQQGAVVVRVHDVMEMGDVVRLADALWK